MTQTQKYTSYNVPLMVGRLQNASITKYLGSGIDFNRSYADGSKVGQIRPQIFA